MRNPLWTEEKIYETVLSAARDNKMPRLKDLPSACRSAIYHKMLDTTQIALRLGLNLSKLQKKGGNIDLFAVTREPGPAEIKRAQLQAERLRRALEACEGCETIWMREINQGHVYCAGICPEGKGVFHSQKEHRVPDASNS